MNPELKFDPKFKPVLQFHIQILITNPENKPLMQTRNPDSWIYFLTFFLKVLSSTTVLGACSSSSNYQLFLYTPSSDNISKSIIN